RQSAIVARLQRVVARLAAKILKVVYSFRERIVRQKVELLCKSPLDRNSQSVIVAVECGFELSDRTQRGIDTPGYGTPHRITRNGSYYRIDFALRKDLYSAHELIAERYGRIAAYRIVEA